MTEYSDFLKSKRRAVGDVGHHCEPGDVHPLLFDFQRHIVMWSVRKGRAAIFADCGLGKTFMQLEWARLSGRRALLIAPLSVARQTIREAVKLGIEVRYTRNADQASGPGIWITNYEMADRFDADFDAVVLDESSILKNHTGITRTALIGQWSGTRSRLACTATPAPNDVSELTNHSEFLGVLPRNEMLAAYFVHDDDGWRLKGHAADPMYRWMAGWATALRRPSDLGYPDTGYELPPLNIIGEVVHVDSRPEGQLFATDLGGVGGRHQARRDSIEVRTARACELVDRPGQWIVWCGLNDEAELVTKNTSGALNVDGPMSPESKAEAFEAFQDGAIRVLVTKPSIAGMGMNFQNCHRMVFVGMSDSYEQYYQAARRCWRFGQTEPVDVHIVTSDLEQQIVSNVRRKEAEVAAMSEQLIAAMSAETSRLSEVV
jgi:Helicase conserved C-terminal domain